MAGRDGKGGVEMVRVSVEMADSNLPLVIQVTGEHTITVFVGNAFRDLTKNEWKVFVAGVLLIDEASCLQ